MNVWKDAAIASHTAKTTQDFFFDFFSGHYGWMGEIMM